MRYIIILIALLTGCTTTHPVVIGCHPKLPPEPDYPDKYLKVGDKPATVAKAYVASRDLRHDYIQLQKRAIKGCE